MKRISYLKLGLLALVLLVTTAHADIVNSYTGAFSADDNQQVVNFSLAGPGTVTLQTWSFAGGTNGSGQLISAGGFAPVLSLFTATGTQDLLAFDAGGVAPSGCGPRNIDPVTSFCLDAYLNLSLQSGTYMVVLTEYDNTPIGPTYSDGFAEDGAGNFTNGPFLLNAGSGYQRTGNWAFDITTHTTAPVPEPSTFVLMTASSVALMWRRFGQRGLK